jgi:hypothetical protein
MIGSPQLRLIWFTNPQPRTSVLAAGCLSYAPPQQIPDCDVHGGVETRVGICHQGHTQNPRNKGKVSKAGKHEYTHSDDALSAGRNEACPALRAK